MILPRVGFRVKVGVLLILPDAVQFFLLLTDKARKTGGFEIMVCHFS